MPRVARECPGGYVYHVWNRAAGRLRLFKKQEGYQAFERVMLEAHERHPIRILDWCLNQPQSAAEVDALRACVRRSGPFGGVEWTAETSQRLNLQWTQRPRGRPRRPK